MSRSIAEAADWLAEGVAGLVGELSTTGAAGVCEDGDTPVGAEEHTDAVRTRAIMTVLRSSPKRDERDGVAFTA